MATRKDSARRQLPTPKDIERYRVKRMNPSSEEYHRLLEMMDERAEIINELREAIYALRRVTEVQFTRMAQMQMDLDGIKRAWERDKAKPA